MALTNMEINEIAAIKDVRDMWGAEDAADMVSVIREQAYAVRFDFISGSPGYCGDYYLIQGDALGSNPIQLIRKDGKLTLI